MQINKYYRQKNIVITAKINSVCVRVYITANVCAYLGKSNII